MKYLLSIFSFETFQIRWRLSKALVLLGLILATLEFGVSRPDWLFRCFPNSSVGVFLKTEEKLQELTAPVVLISGDSRSQEGINEQELQSCLGLPTGAVVNLSFQGCTPYDAWLLLQRNKKKLQARLILYSVSEWQLNQAYPLSPRFYHFAGWKDRSRVQQPWHERIGYFFHTWDMKEVFVGMAESLLQSLVAGRKSKLANYQTERKAEPIADTVQYMYRDHYVLSPAMQWYLEDFLQQVKAAGQNILVLQVPTPDHYMNEVLRTRSKSYEIYRQYTRGLASGNVLLYENASSCGMQRNDFRLDDNTHMAPTGALKFSRILCDSLQTQYPNLMKTLLK